MSAVEALEQMVAEGRLAVIGAFERGIEMTPEPDRRRRDSDTLH
jgi:hypothetical protein